MKQLFILILVLYSFQLQSQSIRICRNVSEQSSFLLESKSEIHVLNSDTLIKIDLLKLKVKERMPINMGLSKLTFDEISIHDELYFTESSGGKVFKLERDSLIRIDNSFSHKMTINSFLFEHNDTIFRYGGYGFWSQRNFFIYFDESTMEWEMIAPINSEKLPSGTSSSIVKNIGDDFYVFGGDKLNPFNPFESSKNNELWKFNIRNRKWDLIGKLRIDFNLIDKYISYGDKYILFDDHTDKLYVADIKNNTFKTYTKTKLQYKLNRFLDPIFHKGVFYCFISVDSNGSVHLSARNEDEFFGRLENEERLYNDYTGYLNSSLILLVILMATLIVYVYRKQIKKRNLISVNPNEVIFKRRIIPFDDKSIRTLNLLLESKEEVRFSEIMDICENKELDYSHNTRVINKMIDQLNIQIISLLRIEETPIQVRKSERDKRIKVYSIDKSLFY